MAIWTPDLSERRGPKYLRIVDAMAEAIADGRLPAGTKLPPHRDLAYRLKVSPNTTSRAYAEAIKRALLRGEVGRGTFVRSPIDPDIGEPESLRRPVGGPIDLSRNLPMAGLAERSIRRVMLDIANDTHLATLLDYQTEADLARHREAGLRWLKGCGIDADMTCVVPVIGGQHGILCALMALLRPGDLLLTEALTYTPVLAMAERLDLKTGAVAMDGAGVLPEAFEAWCKTANPRAFYLTPTLQAPTAVTLSATRRQDIAMIARRHDVLIIEDDVFGPLERDKPSPIARGAPEHTLYVTSLSKAVAPGLRVGFVKAPPKIAAALHHAVNLSVWMTPPTTLEIATRLILDGTAQGLAIRQRAFASRRQGLVADTFGPTARMVGNGHHVWLSLPEGWRADVFVSECARRGVLVTEGRRFAHAARDAPEAIRVCVSHEVSEDRVQRGLEVIADLLRQKPSASPILI